MSGFRLIAIRPMDDEYSKLLIKGELYKFTSSFEILQDSETKEVIDIKQNEKYKQLQSLYKIPRKDIDDLDVSVSAIVGKNGSGKSTLLELLYSFCYILAFRRQTLRSKDSKSKKALRDGLKIELYYSEGEEINRIQLITQNINRSIFNSKSKKWETVPFEFKSFFYSIVVNYSIYGLNEVKLPSLGDLFHKNDGYKTPIVINPYRDKGNININREYFLAQSRLLSNILTFGNDANILEGKKVTGINMLFKPVNIDIIKFDDNERSFSDVLAFFEEFYKQNIIDYFAPYFQKIGDLNFTEKELIYFKSNLKEDIKNGNKGIGFSFFRKEKPKSEQSLPKEILRYYLFKYCIKKVYKIALNYYSENSNIITWFDKLSIEKYQPKKDDYLAIKEKVEYRIPKLNLKNLLKLITADKSHITLKLRQNLNMLKGSLFENVNFDIPDNSIKESSSIYSVEFDIESLSNFDWKTSKKKKIEMENIPLGMFTLDLKINNKYFLNDLSSGEQQLIHSIHTVLYHLYNLNSVHENGATKREYEYKNVNLIFDEIELYFHPEFQRSFLKELHHSISLMNLNHISGINIIFSTHSPFILSDIPNQNVLHLKVNDEGKSIPANLKEQTFGANIHDLLANDFFLKDGFMGEYANKQIEETITYLNSEILKKRITELKKIIKSNKLKDNDNNHLLTELEQTQKEFDSLKVKNENREYHLQLIELIGEPVLRNKLSEMAASIMPVENKKKYLEEQFNIMAKNAGVNINDIKFEK